MYARIERHDKTAILRQNAHSILIIIEEEPAPHSAAAMRQISRDPRLQLQLLTGRSPRLRPTETLRRVVPDAETALELLRSWRLSAHETAQVRACAPKTPALNSTPQEKFTP